MALRDHQPIALEQFNGLWRRGDAEQCPIDHFSDTENTQPIGSSAFSTRDGLGIHQNVAVPLGRILRIYNFITQDANTLLVLRLNDSNQGEIYHVINDGLTSLGPILTISAMRDFAMVPYAGRAYITPFTTYGLIPNLQEKGLQNDFLYVYLGDGTAARKAAGNPPTAGSLTIVNGTGNTDAGFHLFGVAYETNTGFITAPSRFTGFTTSAANGVSFSNIPVSPDAFVVARRLVATKVITNYNGDTTGYQYFFIPDGRIPNNVNTTLLNITFFDADLLEDATHLIDNFAEIPAGANINLYHGRLCLCTTFNDISIVLVSTAGEPEAINQIDGLLIAPLDGNPLTNLQELRDVLYGFKRNRTMAWVDNDDVPSTWPLTIIDQGIGCPVHGIATVVDSGGTNIDYLITASYKGVMLFNGRYADPELSWKIFDYWSELDKNQFRKIQIVNDTVNERLFITLPNGLLLLGNYNNDLDPKKIRWHPFRFDIEITTICFVNVDELIIGSRIRLGG